MMFADFARRAWSVAATLLGWRAEEFWSATPAELAAALPEATGNPVMPSELLSELQERFPD